MDPIPPFIFYTERRLVALTGRKACNLPELVTHLREVTGASIFYHTHQHYLARHFEKPVVYNDFAEWTRHGLQEPRLAEQLAAIDLLSFTSLRELREAIIAAIERFLAETGGRVRACPPGDEFHFSNSKSFVMRTGIIAENAGDLIAKLPHVTNVSLFYHFFEARLRLERPTNDFSAWLGDAGEPELAAEIDRLNPYLSTLDELKEQIAALCARHAARRQEGR
ncbi:MAG: DUF5752 family protein [Bryobacteraceae bacterium]